MGVLELVGCILLHAMIARGKAPPEKCDRMWQKVGCYHDRIIPNRPYPYELVNHRDPINTNWDGHLLDWHKWPQSLHALACKCASMAREMNYEFFGLQFYGECWSGPSKKFFRDGPSKKCIGTDFKPCNDTSETECVGGPFTNYIYRFASNDVEVKVDGGWGDWSAWTACSASCGGGKRYRKRYCDNPEPEYDGKPCNGSKVMEEYCNVDICEPKCNRPLEIGIILDASTSVTRKNWDKTLEFVKRFSRLFDLSPNGTHFGIIRYSWKPSVQFSIGDKKYWKKTSFEHKVEKIKYTYGGTRTDLAINLAGEKFMCKKCCLRKGVGKLILVVTDGKTSMMSAPLDEATKKMKEEGVHFISIGVGRQIDVEELKTIASSDRHAFALNGYNYLEDPLNKLLRMACIKYT